MGRATVSYMALSSYNNENCSNVVIAIVVVVAVVVMAGRSDYMMHCFAKKNKEATNEAF